MKNITQDNREIKIKELARFMHDEYENQARLYGWITQEKCRVKFEDLPEENAKTMLGVALQIVKKYSL